ncbi:MAG: bifunctional riboflavin kinase/FAD synthetase [Acidobacteriaceae bacterium]
MGIFHKLEDIPADFGPSVVSIGNFDGVHRGHQHVLRRMTERARELNARSLVVTFDPHPVRILRPDQAPPLLTPLPQKLKLLEQTGIDAVLVLPFSRDLSMMPPFEFAEEILASALHAVEVHEGFNFHFGHKKEGNVERLKEYGRRLGFEVVVYQAMRYRGQILSSSDARRLVQSGEMARARHVLGRPFSIVSNPGRGRGYGHKYTVPTVNLSRYDELIPRIGVYITQMTINGETFDAVTNVGVRPTFGADSFAIETHILNFHPVDLEPETAVELIFLKRLRDEMKFPSPEVLKEQIGKDIRKAQRYLRLMHRIQL